MRRANQRGFNLTEIMIALVLGLALLAAFLAVLQRCRDEFATNESLARLHDSARQAMTVLTGDVEHAGYYGFNPATLTQLVRAGTVIAGAEGLRQPDPAHATAAAADLPAGSHDCGINFAVDLELPVQGSNNSFAAGSGASDCAPTASAGGARAGSDTLTVRHASLESAQPHAGRLQLYSRRLAAYGAQDLFADGHPPGPVNGDNEVRDVEVRTYYIAGNSVERPGWPALRVKALTEAGGAAQFRDEEVMPGVEDLQVEFGVEDSAGLTRYRPPGPDTLRGQRVVAVRLWLRMRADTTERGFGDPRELRYADVVFVPGPVEATQRRVLIEHTVALRNPRSGTAAP